MANSSSSDESSKAPEKFHVSSASNNDDDDDVYDGGVHQKLRDNKHTKVDPHSSATRCLRCPLCCKQQQRFHCRSCVKNGNILYSATDRAGNNSLFEKQQKYLNYQASLKAHSNQYERLIQQKKNKENREYEIKQNRRKLTLLQQLIAEKRKRLQILAQQHDELCKANLEKRKNLPKYPVNVKRLEEYVLDRIEKIGQLREDHQQLLDDLKQTSRSRILLLVKYIFPITDVVLKGDEEKVVAERTEDSEKIAALADAKNTSYIRGKWVLHNSGIKEMQYRIVAPSLPANGDYTAYLDWLSENKHDVPKTMGNEITPSRVEAFRIVGALTYTTQLTQLMSFYLNVRLPHKLAYGDFCRKLNDSQFMRKVSRINSNIMYLAYTQQVQLTDLKEDHTLENILAILDLNKSDLGRHGYHEVNNAPLMKSVDSLLLGIETATESESEDENSLRLDWEAVPNLPTQPEMANSNVTVGQQSTIAEGLITSAAKGITSIFRWIK